jgi:hypothetical protein
MPEIDLDTEIREYQWRRRFEHRPRHAARMRRVLIASIVALIIGAVARSVYFHNGT